MEPSMTQEGFKRKLTAILSADAVGYMLRPGLSDSARLNLADIAKRCQKHDLPLAA